MGHRLRIPPLVRLVARKITLIRPQYGAIKIPCPATFISL